MPSDEMQVLYCQAKAIQDRILFLRKSCVHAETYEGLYSWRPGCIENYKFCKECDEPIENLGPWNSNVEFNLVNDQYLNCKLNDKL